MVRALADVAAIRDTRYGHVAIQDHLAGEVQALGVGGVDRPPGPSLADRRVAGRQERQLGCAILARSDTRLPGAIAQATVDPHTRKSPARLRRRGGSGEGQRPLPIGLAPLETAVEAVSAGRNDGVATPDVIALVCTEEAKAALSGQNAVPIRPIVAEHALVGRTIRVVGQTLAVASPALKPAGEPVAVFGYGRAATFKRAGDEMTDHGQTRLARCRVEERQDAISLLLAPAHASLVGGGRSGLRVREVRRRLRRPPS